MMLMLNSVHIMRFSKGAAPAFFRTEKYNLPFFPPSLDRENRVPAKNRETLLEKCVYGKILDLKSIRLCVKTSFCF